MLPIGKAEAGEPKLEIRLVAAKNPAKRIFEVNGLKAETLDRLKKADWKPAQWQAVFAVSVDRGEPSTPAMLGTYRVVHDLLQFEPRFPLQPGLRYRAVLHRSALPGSDSQGKDLVSRFHLPKAATSPSTVVTQVFPSADRLPENQLKFYLHFSAPMSRGEAYRHVHLFMASGKEVDLPFLELGEELWDPHGQRFTQFFDPGRIKRGLKPREEVGPALEEGKRYTLVIDQDWPDALGQPLRSSFRKEFTVGPPDDQRPDPKTWKLQPGAAGTRQPLNVTFPKPLDHAMLERVVQVRDSTGQPVAGTIQISNQEKCWQFTPQMAWSAGRFELLVDTTLEDLAGNSIAKPFEIDVLHPIQKKINTDRVRIPFDVAPAAKRS